MKNRMFRPGYIDTARPLPFQMRNARWLEGEGEGDGDDGAGDDAADAPDGGEATDGTPGDDLAEQLEAQKRINRDLEKKMKGEAGPLKARVAELEAELAKAQGRESEFAEAQKAREQEAAALARANSRIVKAELKAAAAGKLADPTDAFHFIDANDFEVDDDGNVDEDEIASAIADLIDRKPHLAAQGGTKGPKPDRSQGNNGNGTATTAQQFAAAIDKFL